MMTGPRTTVGTWKQAVGLEHYLGQLSPDKIDGKVGGLEYLMTDDLLIAVLNASR